MSIANIRKLRTLLFVVALLSIWNLAQSQAGEFPKWPVKDGGFSPAWFSALPE